MHLDRRTFSIDEDASSRLEKYLNDLAEKLSGSSDKDEITEDIESRIADHLASLPKDKTVSLEDVEKTLDRIGPVDNYITEDSTDKETKSGGASKIPWKIILIIAGIIIGIPLLFSIILMIGVFLGFKGFRDMADNILENFTDTQKEMIEDFEEDRDEAMEEHQERTDEMFEDFEETSDESYEDFLEKTEELEDKANQDSEEMKEDFDEAVDEMEDSYNE